MWLWHNIKPMEFYKMGEGEKQIMYGYIKMEIEQRIAEQERLDTIFAKR